MANKTLKTRFLVRRGTYNEIKNIVLANGEPGYDTTNDIFVIGDGSHKFSELTTQVPQAEVRYNEIISRGENLVINGNGFMGDNTNFTALKFDGSQSNNTPGSFTQDPGWKSTPRTKYKFPVQADKVYSFSVDFKSNGHPCAMYNFLSFYDADLLEISAGHHMYLANTLTKLARDVKSGDTVVYFEDLTHWDPKARYGHRMIVWDYQNSFGYKYPANTYSRHRYELYTQTDGKTPSPAVHKENNTIVLDKPWTGPTLVAGTEISQGTDGATYKYGWIGNPGTEWETHEVNFAGIDFSGGNRAKMFPPGTAYVGVGFLWNYQGKDPEAQAWITNVSVREVRERALNADYALSAKDAMTLQGTSPYNKVGAGSCGWTNTTTDAKRLVTNNTLAHFNGAYADTNSNLVYCKGGIIASESWVNSKGYITASALTPYLKLSGGTMTGPITIGMGDGNGLLIPVDDKGNPKGNINVKGTSNTIFGFYGSNFIIGHSSYGTNIRGAHLNIEGTRAKIESWGNAGFYLQGISTTTDYAKLGTQDPNRVFFIQPGTQGTVTIGGDTNNTSIQSDKSAKLIVHGNIKENNKLLSETYLGIKDKAEDSKHADVATKTQQSLTVNKKQGEVATKIGTYNGETALTIDIPNDSIVFTDEYQPDSVVLKYIIVNGQAWKVAGNGLSTTLDYDIIN